VGNLAGDVLQVVSPRTADGDDIAQRASTGEKEFGRISVPSARSRA
jgi:hypothetical protein